MNCRCNQQKDYAILISAAVDGALSPEEHTRLMAHLSDCPACRAAYEQTLLLHGAFSDWEAPEPPGDLTAAVMDRVRTERVRTKRRPLRHLATAAACLALILCGARLTPLFRPDAPAADRAFSEPVMVEADQQDALPSSASEGIPSAAPEVRTADAFSEEQLMEGVITYFNNAPHAGDTPAPDEAGKVEADKRQVVSAVPLAVPTLSSSDPELLSWMTANIAAAGYNSLDAANSADATAWLISGEEYQALQAHIEETSMDYEMDWGDAAESPSVNAAVVGAEDEDVVICVVYLQAEEPAS